MAWCQRIALHGQPLSDFGPDLAIGAVWMALLLAAIRAYRFVK